MKRTTLINKMAVLGIRQPRQFDVIADDAPEPLPRVVYRIRVRRWNGTWTVGDCALADLPIRKVELMLRLGEAELVMTQEPAATGS